MTDELVGRVVMVTGGGGGIGQAAAERFAEAGAKVVVVDLPGGSGAEVASSIEGRGGAAVFMAADVTREDEVSSLVGRILDLHGRLDGAFNNAGVEQGHVPLHEITLQQWSRVIGVDLTGVFLCIKHQVPAMLSGGGGSIVNTASGLGQVAIPNAAEYIAAKHGVIGLTRAAAVDYASKGIRVNAVLPGIVETPLIERAAEDPAFAAVLDTLRSRHPVGRLGRPSEIADAALWLLSDRSSFVTGAALAVDGGYTAI